MLEFARAGASIGATSATLEKTRILGAYFRTLNDDDLRRAAVYMSGRAFAPSKRRTLGLGWSTVSKVVSSLSERGEDELGTIFRKHSDLGDWAGEALDGSTRPEPVTLADVERSLEAIRTARGNAKATPLESLLRRMDPESARFFIKIVSGEMRIGLSEGLVEAAIADAFGVPITQVKRVHLVTGDIGETAVRCKRGDFEASTITPFQPMRFMLASPVEAPVDVFDRMRAGKVWTEEKYDGVRCQLHRQGTRVELFSRDLKETTGAFPELVENAPAIGHDVLFDGEVLAHRDGRVLRFFELQRRLGRKKVDLDLRRGSRARQRGADGEGSAQPLYARTSRAGVAEVEAAAGHPRRGGNGGRMGSRKAKRRAVRLHLCGERHEHGSAGQRWQGVHRADRCGDRDLHQTVPRDNGPEHGPHAVAEARGRLRGGV